MQQTAKLPQTTAKPDTLKVRMKKRRRLLSVAAVLVVLAISDFIVMRGAGDIEPPLVQGWRLFITVVVALYLARGTSSARWLVVILSVLTSLVGVVAVGLLAITGALDPAFRYLLWWFGFLAFAHAIVAYFLAYSQGVAREVRRLENEAEPK